MPPTERTTPSPQANSPAPVSPPAAAAPQLGAIPVPPVQNRASPTASPTVNIQQPYTPASVAASSQNPMKFGTNSGSGSYNKKLILSVVIATMLVIAGAASAFMLLSKSANNSIADAKKEASSASASKKQPAVKSNPQASKTQNSTAPMTNYTPFPDDVRQAFIKEYVDLGWKVDEATCNIDWIQQHYTLDQYNSIRQHPDSMAFEDMILLSSEIGPCKF